MVDFAQKLNAKHGIDAAYQRLKDKIEHPEKSLALSIKVRHVYAKCVEVKRVIDDVPWDGALKWIAGLPCEAGDPIKDCVWECVSCSEVVTSQEIDCYFLDFGNGDWLFQKEYYEITLFKRQVLLVNCLLDEMDDDERYNERERDFVANIKWKRIDRGEELSQKQSEWLERIWKKYN